jgi:hypothetical protein
MIKITRENKREKERKINFLEEFINLQKHFFKDLKKMLAAVKDPRHKSYIDYGAEIMLFSVLLKNACGIVSMTSMTEKFNKDECIDNVSRVLGCELEEFSHYDTINNFLCNLKPIEIEKTTYYHKFLEAKLVAGDMVFSIASEFIENEDENVSKQDCELKAFKRLAVTLKKKYPKLPICLLGDSLYTCEPVFEICNNNGWKYLMRFKEGRIKSVADEIIYFGRSRWKIENQGFNNQKKKRYNLEHANSKNYNAMKNHYLITQLADILRQLYEKGVDKIRDLNKSIKEISSSLLESFRTQSLTKTEDISTTEKRIQIRFT